MAVFKTLDDVDVHDKRVLIRVDLNVPMQAGEITDTTRIERLKITLDDITQRGGKAILLAHFGRPKGKVVPEMSLRPVAKACSTIFGKHVVFVSPDAVKSDADYVNDMEAGDIVLLENTRFYPGEEHNDIELAQYYAALGDIYVNDAFSAAHRAHASTAAITQFLPAYAGRLMQAELNALSLALSNPKRPVGAVVGGAKVSTKIDLLENLVNKIDVLIIGGGMANTFNAALGADMGDSLQEPAMYDKARAILKAAAANECRVILPSDGKVTAEFAAGAPFEVMPINADTIIPKGKESLDAGDATIRTVVSAFEKLQTLIWNGPFGAFEMPPFDEATIKTAKAAATLTKQGKLVSVAGGGDTVLALNLAGAAAHFTYISTAGGAFLEWMEGKILPGVAALENNAS